MKRRKYNYALPRVRCRSHSTVLAEKKALTHLVSPFQYRALAPKEHTLETYMNMAVCVLMVEHDTQSVAKIYQEVLTRWPFALEAAYELNKLAFSFDVAISSTTNAASTTSSRNASQVPPDNDATSVLGLSWLNSVYLGWSKVNESFSGDLPYLMKEEQEEMASKQEVVAKQASKSGEIMRWPLPKSTDNVLKLMSCVQMAMYRGAWAEVETLVTRAQSALDRDCFGLEFLAYAYLRGGKKVKLAYLHDQWSVTSPSRWETWFIAAMKEWGQRDLESAFDSIGRARQMCPTSSLILVAIAYMYIFRVKDARLRPTVPDNKNKWTKVIRDSAALSLDAIRVAWHHSKDPFVAQSVLAVHTEIASLGMDHKLMDALSDVDAKSPLLRRFKTNPNQCYAEAEANPALAIIYSRLLAHKARLAVAKNSLIQYTVDAANAALKFRPDNGLATATLILVERHKNVDVLKLLEQLRAAAETAKSSDARTQIMLEMLPLYFEADLLDRAREIATSLFADNPLNDSVTYWSELIRLRLEQMEEEEEDEMDA